MEAIERIEPSSALTTISEQQISSKRIARQWLVQFAEITQKGITPALANIWAEQLADIEPKQLERCCGQLMKTWKVGFLPVPGNIRELAEAENVIKRFQEEEQNQRERKRIEAKLEYDRAIAYAEQKRLLPPLKEEFPRVKLTPIFEPIRVIDFMGRQKELARQKNIVLEKYPPNSREKAPA